MTLILDETGRLENVTNKEIDSLKRIPYKHNIEDDITEQSDSSEGEFLEFDEQDVVIEDPIFVDPVVELFKKFNGLKGEFDEIFTNDECAEEFEKIKKCIESEIPK